MKKLAARVLEMEAPALEAIRGNKQLLLPADVSAACSKGRVLERPRDRKAA